MSNYRLWCWSKHSALNFCINLGKNNTLIQLNYQIHDMVYYLYYYLFIFVIRYGYLSIGMYFYGLKFYYYLTISYTYIEFWSSSSLITLPFPHWNPSSHVSSTLMSLCVCDPLSLITVACVIMSGVVLFYENGCHTVIQTHSVDQTSLEHEAVI